MLDLLFRLKLLGLYNAGGPSPFPHPLEQNLTYLYPHTQVAH